MQLTFFLTLDNPAFFNYTNLSAAYPPGKIYYFTNRNNNANNGKQFLTAPIAPYSAGTTYNQGDLALDGVGTVFMAIRANDPGHLFDLSHADHWMSIDANRYLTEADPLTWIPTLSTYTFATPQPSATVNVWGYNTATHDYTYPVIARTTNFGGLDLSFTLDLRALRPGKYHLNVNGADQWIYINDELIGTRVFGVIDIFQESSLPAGYQLLDGTGKLLSPTYTLAFLNRATIWKYILSSGANGSISDNASVYAFAGPPASVVYSTSPIPLAELALRLTLTVNPANPHPPQYTPIACASPERLAQCTLGGETFTCSEIYLHF
jgi:hypothetical protein